MPVVPVVVLSVAGAALCSLVPLGAAVLSAGRLQLAIAIDRVTVQIRDGSRCCLFIRLSSSKNDGVICQQKRVEKPRSSVAETVIRGRSYEGFFFLARFMQNRDFSIASMGPRLVKLKICRRAATMKITHSRPDMPCDSRSLYKAFVAESKGLCREVESSGRRPPAFDRLKR